MIDKQLIVGGSVGQAGEWCNLGRLAPSASRFDGQTLDLRHARYEKKGELVRESADKDIKVTAGGRTVTATDIKTGKVVYKIEADVPVAEIAFITTQIGVLLYVRGADDRVGFFERPTGKAIYSRLQGRVYLPATG